MKYEYSDNESLISAYKFCLTSIIHSFFPASNFMHVHTLVISALFLSGLIQLIGCNLSFVKLSLVLYLCILTTSKVKPPTLFFLSPSHSLQMQDMNIIFFFYSLCFSPQYAAWLVMWMTWNVFIICFYLEVGDLSRVRKLFLGLFLRLHSSVSYPNSENARIRLAVFCIFLIVDKSHEETKPTMSWSY